MRISTWLLEQVATEARLAAPDECCGLLLSSARNGCIDTILPARNVAPDPRHAFEIDPATLIDAHKRARSGQAAIIGCYHSHPTGSAVPSVTDAASALENGSYWLIVGAAGTDLTLWLTRDGGACHGRFDPVRIFTA